MNNEVFSNLVLEYDVLAETKKEIEKKQIEIRKKMLALMKKENMDDYSYAGAKATVIKTSRQMYIKEKLIEKFGTEQLKSCIKTISTESVRISFKQEYEEN